MVPFQEGRGKLAWRAVWGEEVQGGLYEIL